MFCARACGWVPCMHRQEAGACMHRYIYVAFVLVFISLLRIVGTLLNPRKKWSQNRFLVFSFRFISSCMDGLSAFHARRVCGCGCRNLGAFTVIIYEVHFCVIWDFGTLGHERSAHGKPQVGKSKISRFGSKNSHFLNEIPLS